MKDILSHIDSLELLVQELKTARLEKNLSIDDVCQLTNVKKKRSKTHELLQVPPVSCYVVTVIISSLFCIQYRCICVNSYLSGVSL